MIHCGIWMVWIAIFVSLGLIGWYTHYREGFETLGTPEIPRQIWQTYKTSLLPKKASECQRTWTTQNDVQYTFMDDEQISTFMRKYFDATTVQVFDSFPLGVMKADFWRYCVVYIYGGIYADIDTTALQPVSKWDIQKEDKFIVALENDIHFCQWTFASVPKHPVLEKVIEFVVAQASNGIDTSNEHFVHHHTGPGIWTRAIHAFLGYPIEQKARHTFTLYQTSEEHRQRFKRWGIRLEDRAYFSNGMVKNLFGSTQFSDGYASWMAERDDLLRKRKSEYAHGTVKA